MAGIRRYWADSGTDYPGKQALRGRIHAGKRDYPRHGHRRGLPQLSGSTVFHQNVPFPLKNIPVVSLTDISRETIRRELGKQEDSAILAFPGINSPGYREVAAMAEEIAAGTGGNALICLEQDMAKALGQALALRLGPNAEILCIDRVKVSEGSYLDVGAPVGPALPVVVKTLVLGK